MPKELTPARLTNHRMNSIKPPLMPRDRCLRRAWMTKTAATAMSRIVKDAVQPICQVRQMLTGSATQAIQNRPRHAASTKPSRIWSRRGTVSRASKRCPFAPCAPGRATETAPAQSVGSQANIEVWGATGPGRRREPHIWAAPCQAGRGLPVPGLRRRERLAAAIERGWRAPAWASSRAKSRCFAAGGEAGALSG